jgi:hypothetical protein
MFSVKLTVDGQTYSQPLHLSMAPRLHVSDADMMAQYDLATKMTSHADDLHDAVNDMLSLQKQLADRPDGKALSDKMQAVIDIMANLRSKTGEDPLNYAIGLDNKLADFAGSVSGGEGKPTEGMLEVATELEAQYVSVMAKWKAIQTTDVPAYNAKQKTSGGKEITPGPRPAACGGGGRGAGGQ